MIGKRASVDHYCAIAIDRQNYADKDDKPADGRFKTIIVCSDLRDREIDPFYLRVLVDTVTRVQPDIIVFNGDIFDQGDCRNACAFRTPAFP